jgi:asparagine synthase (glutamine-hydrolysing)
MSVQFGKWSFDGEPCAPEYIDRVKRILAPYGPDGSTTYEKAGVCMLYHAFHTTRESRLETQPHITRSGVVVTWDGRLDNRAELVGKLRNGLSIDSTDVSIAAATYEKWGTECFSKLIGDWALSIWHPHDRSLILAKDPLGARHLFYSLERNEITWSTLPDPLVLLSGRSVQIDEEYVAGWLVFSPATHLTPYVGIDAVPPASSVFVRNGKAAIREYWDFDPNNRVRYRTDAEYEEHFRNVFAESVQRRLRSDAPILSELSGGMDSSSIVCMADTLIARGVAETPRLDTVSYYDDSEPNWNERPYFAEVDKKRGCTGCHIDVGSQNISDLGLDNGHFAAIPGYSPPSEFTNQFAFCMISHGNRVLLSGTGGDEVTGGVPTPTPEFADLLVRAQFGTLAHQLKVWALNKRKPWFHLFFETAREFFPRTLVGVQKHRRPAPWLNAHFVKQHRSALAGYEPRLRVFGGLPSFQMNTDTLNGLRGQLGSSSTSNPPYEKRCPYLDRDLLEFLYAIPREQLVRPGQRRSLMRRALAGIVPDVILQRRRKAFVSRTPLAALKQDWGDVVEMSHNMLSEKIGIVDAARFLRAVQDACLGKEISLSCLLRTLVLESWLRGLAGLEPSPFVSHGSEGFSTIDALSPAHTRVQLAE